MLLPNLLHFIIHPSIHLLPHIRGILNVNHLLVKVFRGNFHPPTDLFEKSCSIRTNKEGTPKLNYLFNVAIFICWVKFWWFFLRDFSWGTCFKCWCCDLFRRWISTELNTGLGHLVQTFWPKSWYLFVTYQLQFQFTALCSFIYMFHLTCSCGWTQEERILVLQYFPAVNENIANCDVYRKCGHYCGNTTNRFKHIKKKKHKKEYRAAAERR